MDLNLDKNTITLYGKSYKYDSLIKNLSGLSGEDIYHFISNRGIALPRKMNCMAMISVLNEKIKYLHSNSLSKDYFQRLQHYKDFGETQLTELFKTICDENDFFHYRFNLLNLIMLNFAALALNDGEVQYLKTVKKSKLESFQDYSGYISACSLEQTDTFDGVHMEDLKKNLLVSSTANDIIELGAKYGIDIPQHLTRDQYYEFIVYYLDKKGKLSPEIQNDLSNMTLAGLSTFSRRNGVPLQPSLTKEDYVTYLFYFLESCEIVTTSINTIIASENYDPIEFKVDLSQISVFGEAEAKRIIHFEGDDDPEYNEKMDKIIEDINKPLEPTFIPFEKTEAVDAPIRPGEQTMADDDADFELEDYEIEEVNEEAKEAETEEVKEPEEPSMTDEEIHALIAKDQVEENTDEETVTDGEKIDISKVIKNDEYASKKLKELKNGNRKIAILSCLIGVSVLVLAFVIYALVR